MGHTLLDRTANMTPIVVLLGLLAVSSAWVIPHPMYQTYRSQDELGAYAFGYHGGPSSRSEVRDHFGVVRGAYNLVGADGEVQKYQYISDALGYRLLSAPALVAPEPVAETAEVKAAREEFETLFKSAQEKSAPAPAAPAPAGEAAPAEESAAPVAVEAV